MTRFGDDYDEYFPNQGELWWANVRRALNGKRGQQALRDLEAALLELPEKVLISSRMADDQGHVCAVGALVLHKRMAAGDAPQAVLDELAGVYPEACWCGHDRAAHNDVGCTATRKRYGFDTPQPCGCHGYEAYTETDGGDNTARKGVQVGLTYALAWRLAQVNDEDYGSCTPEERYSKVLAWVRNAQVPVAA